MTLLLQPQLSWDTSAKTLSVRDPALGANVPIFVAPGVLVATYLALAANPTAGVQAAIAAFNANLSFGSLIFPPDMTEVVGGLPTITRGGTIAGDGTSVLRITGANQNGLVFDTPAAVFMQNLRVETYAATTGGTGVTIQCSGPGVNFGSSFTNVSVVGFWDNASIDGAAFKWSAGYVVDFVRSGIIIDNTESPDEGDSELGGGLVIDTSKASPGNTLQLFQAGIRQRGSGGLKFGAGVKVLHGDYGYLLSLRDGVNTSVLPVVGASFEGQRKANLGFSHEGATGTFSLVTISGCELALAPRLVQVFGTRGFLSLVTIDDIVGSTVASSGENQRLFDVDCTTALLIGPGINVLANGAVNHTFLGPLTSYSKVYIGLGSGSFTQRYLNSGTSNYFEPKTYDLPSQTISGSAVTQQAFGSLYRNLATINWPEPIDTAFPRSATMAEDFTAPQGSPLVGPTVGAINTASGSLSVLTANSGATLKVTGSLRAVPLN